LQGLDNKGFTPANGYNFAFAGSGVAAGIPNVPMSDFNAVVHKPWAATDVGFKDLGGQYVSGPYSTKKLAAPISSSPTVHGRTAPIQPV
jgi:hypothetical protein